MGACHRVTIRFSLTRNREREMTIEEEQAEALRVAARRAGATDFETMRDIVRICRHSHCAVCKAIHRLVVERTGLDESDMSGTRGGA